MLFYFDHFPHANNPEKIQQNPATANDPTAIGIYKSFSIKDTATRNATIPM